MPQVKQACGSDVRKLAPSAKLAGVRVQESKSALLWRSLAIKSASNGSRYDRPTLFALAPSGKWPSSITNSAPIRMTPFS